MTCLTTPRSAPELETSEWFTGPAWLVDKEQWPKQPECSREVNDEHKPFKETILYNQEREADEWTELLSRNEFWRTLRVTAWALRFLHNATVKHRGERKRTGPLTAEEITSAKNHWIKREQRNIQDLNLQRNFFLCTFVQESLNAKDGFKGTSQRTSKEECLQKNSYGILTSRSFA